jgi:hypothetical protein
LIIFQQQIFKLIQTDEMIVQAWHKDHFGWLGHGQRLRGLETESLPARSEGIWPFIPCPRSVISNVQTPNLRNLNKNIPSKSLSHKQTNIPFRGKFIRERALSPTRYIYNICGIWISSVASVSLRNLNDVMHIVGQVDVMS